MYPSVMLSEYPYPFEYSLKSNLDKYGVTDCLLEYKGKLPILPYRTKEGKLIFARGRVRGVWDNTEINFSLNNGYRILKVFGGITYKYSCYPFKDFITDIYDLRQQSASEYKKIIYKLIMNSLYGKFGQVNDGVNIVSLYDDMGVAYNRTCQDKIIPVYKGAF
jgi:hypothetical protein